MTETFILEKMRAQGKIDAIALQAISGEMTGTELNAQTDVIPAFTKAVKVKNMLDRPIGFVCKSSAGRVVALLQPYNSNVYTQEPEELPAQWRFKWSTDPAKALPFVKMATSPYNIGDCCTWEGAVKRSTIDNNVHSPAEYPQGWEDVSNG